LSETSRKSVDRINLILMSAAILIVDDHPVVPLALGALVEQRFTGLRPLQAGTLRQARAVYQVEPTLAATILDLRLPDTAGLEGLTELCALRPEVPVVVYTALESEPLRRNALSSGAAAVVGKTELPLVLMDAVGDALVRSLGESMPEVMAGRSRAELSPRQQQIWQAIADGLSNQEIASRHGISLNTTKAHVREMLQRLGVRNRTEAATLYVRRPARRL
jgi:DNA-binding NarL/FixJ family response regulator